MSYAQNALMIGLVGILIFLYRMYAALQDDTDSPAPWQIDRVIKAFQKRQAKITDPYEKKAHQRILNGFYLLLIYTLVAAYFFVSSI